MDTGGVARDAFRSVPTLQVLKATIAAGTEIVYYNQHHKYNMIEIAYGILASDSRYRI